MNDAAPASTPDSTQTQYEVRLDWGLDGLRAIGAGAGAVVVVDVLRRSSDVLASLEAGEPAAFDGGETDAVAREAAALGVPVLLAGLRNRTAVARHVLGLQVARGERVRVAVVAIGDRRGSGVSTAVEDTLAAGAVVDALASLGVDYASPEAAAACASYLGLTRAVGHLITASVAGKRLVEAGLRDVVVAAGRTDDSETVPVVSDGGYRAA